MSVRLLKPGEEPGQGVGYLEDGTMIVVEGGHRFMEREIPCILGNVDRKVLSLGRDSKRLRRRIREGRGAAAAWAALSLGEAERAWLSSRPAELRLALGAADAWIRQTAWALPVR